MTLPPFKVHLESLHFLHLSSPVDWGSEILTIINYHATMFTYKPLGSKKLGVRNPLPPGGCVFRWLPSHWKTTHI